MQPLPATQVIITVPAETPVTMPVDDPIVAIAVADELHVMPVAESLSAVVIPTHTCSVPVITDAVVLTVIILVA
jgi:hypothetical protein